MPRKRKRTAARIFQGSGALLRSCSSSSLLSIFRPSRASRLLWDSLALLSFQVPIYAAIIAISGATGFGLLKGVLGAAVMMLVLGRPYGIFLNAVRRLFDLPQGGGASP